MIIYGYYYEGEELEEAKEFLGDYSHFKSFGEAIEKVKERVKRNREKK